MLHLSTAYYLGIDPSEDLLDACLLQQEQVLGSLCVPHQRQGWEQLHQWCQQQPEPVLWVIEATGSLWQQVAWFAVERGYAVYLVNPKGVHYYRKALLLPTKTDALDAELIASYGRLRVLRGELCAWTPPAAELRQLRGLLRQRSDYQRMVTEQRHRLRALARQGASATELAVARAVLQSLQQAQREVEALIARWEREHPQYARVLRLWRTIPGVGRWTALVLLAETGGLHRFSSGRALARYASLVPEIRQSGKKTGEGYHLNTDGNRVLRGAFYLASVSAVRARTGFREVYHRLVSAGKGKKEALCAVARRLLLVAYALYRDGQAYDPSRRGAVA